MKLPAFLLASALGLAQSFAQATPLVYHPAPGPTIVPVVSSQGIPLAPSDYATPLAPATLLPPSGQQCKIGSGLYKIPVGTGNARRPLTVVSKSPQEMLSPMYVASDIVNVPYTYTSEGQLYLFLQHLLKPTDIPYTETLRAPAVKAFMAMADAAASQGIAIKLYSGYRAYDTQCGTFNHKIRNEFIANVNLHRENHVDEMSAIKSVNTRSAIPGSSEHQLGTAMDIVSYIPSGPHQGWNVEFEMDQTPAFAWLQANAYKFGFVLSYPKSASGIPSDVNPRTGYVYEPWHWRYIGPVPAGRYQACRARGMTTQEFLRALNKNPQFVCSVAH